MDNSWLDVETRKVLEARRAKLRAQIQELEKLLGAQSAPVVASSARATAHDTGGRVVRAGRKPMSEEARRKMGRRMKKVWAERKAKLARAEGAGS